MHITLAHIGSASGSSDALDAEVRNYVKKINGLASAYLEHFKTEVALLQWVERQSGRTPLILVFLDSRGREMTSEELATWIGIRSTEGTQHVLFAIGPADGWSNAARSRIKKPGMILSLGPMTLAHSLARLVLAEQLFRAWAILTGHPYHKGH